MNQELYVGRNDALEFARRTRRNLEHIERCSTVENVHVVTQFVNSLLGLIVFLKEKTFFAHIEKLQLERLKREGWPQFRVMKGECSTLEDIIKHLRNAAAHGRIKFSSDSDDLNEVEIHIEDRRTKASTPYWCACVKASELRLFCLKLIELLENTIG